MPDKQLRILNNGRTLDVTSLEPRLKHPTIFEWFAALQPGESFIIKNDHDPKPLYYQMLGELGPVFTWNYSEQGPTQWQVSIGKNKTDELTVGEIAAKDFRKAQVMKEKGIDFCCGGKKSLHQAATEANITPGDLEKAFQEAEKKDNTPTQNFDLWDADFLADYIYNQHHKYFYKNADLISELTAKVRDHHGKNHPELIKLAELVETLFADLEQHFNKEEKVLFPYIKDLTRLEKENIPLAKRINISEGPLTVMHLEHELAGDMLKSICNVTHDYKIPEGACNSFRLLYNMLEDLESDLHQHIHLENNILFPKAIELEKRAVRPNVY